MEEKTFEEAIALDGRLRAIAADFLKGLGAVVQAGLEDGHEDTPVIELPKDTVERAGDIYRGQTTS